MKAALLISRNFTVYSIVRKNLHNLNLSIKNRDVGREGVKNDRKFCDVMYELSLKQENWNSYLILLMGR
jgi:hypothetical protein